jgi:ATP synthase protein I
VSIEPERRVLRAVDPWGIPALAVAFVVASIFGGTGAAWSAAIAVIVVFANLNAYGVSLAWAARISPTVVFAVAMGGYVVRLALVATLLVLLDRFAFFSALSFCLALVPCTVFVLVFELRLLSGRLTSELWTLPPTQGRPAS